MTQSASFSLCLFDANIEKAIKLFKEINDGPSKDTDLVASLIYPWNIHRFTEKDALSD